MAARPPNLGQPLEECVDEAQAGYQRREPERRIDESELRDSLAQGGSLGPSEETLRPALNQGCAQSGL